MKSVNQHAHGCHRVSLLARLGIESFGSYHKANVRHLQREVQTWVTVPKELARVLITGKQL
jgi:hypothetical protein